MANILLPPGSGGLSAPTVSAKTADYTLVLTDANNVITMNSANPCRLIVPLNADVAFDTGTTITVHQIGAGAVLVRGLSGVTVNTALGDELSTQHKSFKLTKIATDTWQLEDTVALTSAVESNTARSIEFNAADEEMTCTRANFGALNLKKWALSMHFIVDTTDSNNRRLWTIGADGGVNSADVWVLGTGAAQASDLLVRMWDDGGEGSGSQIVNVVAATNLNDSSWHHLYIQFDTTQATAANRVRTFIDGSENTSHTALGGGAAVYPSLNDDMDDNWDEVTVCGGSDGESAIIGKIFDCAVFNGESNDLPPVNFLYDNSSHIDIHNIGNGLQSLLDVPDNSDVTDDHVLGASKWSLTGTPAASATLPS